MLMSGRTYDCLRHDGTVGIRWRKQVQVTKLRMCTLIVEQAASGHRESQPRSGHLRLKHHRVQAVDHVTCSKWFRSSANGLRPSGTCSVTAQKFNMLNSCDSWSFWSSQVIRNCSHVTPFRRLICSARSWLRCSVIRKNQLPPVLCRRKTGS
jgi:hypothetical protein